MVRGIEKRRIVAEECKKSGVSLMELRSGSRRGWLPAVRTKIVRGLVENYGVGVAEVARQVGISTSAVFEDPDENFVQLVNSVPLVPVATPDQRLNSPTIRWRKRARLSETDLPRPDSGWPGC